MILAMDCRVYNVDFRLKMRANQIRLMNLIITNCRKHRLQQFTNQKHNGNLILAVRNLAKYFHRYLQTVALRTGSLLVYSNLQLLMIIICFQIIDLPLRLTQNHLKFSLIFMIWFEIRTLNAVRLHFRCSLLHFDSLPTFCLVFQLETRLFSTSSIRFQRWLWWIQIDLLTFS